MTKRNNVLRERIHQGIFVLLANGKKQQLNRFKRFQSGIEELKLI